MYTRHITTYRTASPMAPMRESPSSSARQKRARNEHGMPKIIISDLQGTVYQLIIRKVSTSYNKQLLAYSDLSTQLGDNTQ